MSFDPAPSGPAPEQDDPLDEIVAECLEREPPELEGALDAACARHPELADEIRRRISALRQVGLVLGRVRGDDETFPERLGDFRLLSRLGGGGMGVVYRARQESLGREVALKLIRPEHLYFPRARERFRRETEAVARLAHPGIVPIYTVGEEDDIPFYAMELVDGCTLAEVVHELAGRAPESLSGSDLSDALSARSSGRRASGSVFEGPWTKGCVEIAIQVAHALQHAHERGVLHRDVKPSNVALSLDGRALLLDFGLASTGGGASPRVTASGSALGSLLYMSPEQIRGDSSQIDRRTDVYALGVTLYELLTLQAPYFDTHPLGARQAILDGRADPIRARNRAVSKDLEIVCLMAMERDAGRRYATAADFARDLRNVLELRPIEARAPSAALRARRWIRRNPAASTAAGLALLLAVGIPTELLRQERERLSRERERADEQARHAGELGLALEAARVARDAAQASEAEERAQRDLARIAAEDAETVAEFLTELFAAADPANARGRLVAAKDLLDRAAERLRTELAEQPEVRARLLVRIGQSYSSLGEYASARPLLEEALEIRRARFGEDSAEFAEALYGLGNCLRLVGDREALPVLERALAIRRALGGAPDELLARYQVSFAAGLCAARRFEEATLVLGEADELSRRLPGDRRSLRELVLSNLATALQQVRRHEDAIRVAREAIELSRELHGEPHPGLVSSLNTLALSLKGLRRLDEARAIYDELLAAAERLYTRESDRFAIFAMNKASLLDDLGEYGEAERLYDEAWAVFGRVVGPDNPHRVACRGNMGGLYVRTRRWELARDAYEDCLPRLLAIDGPGSTRAAVSQWKLGLCWEALGDLDRAAAALREALAIAERTSDGSRGYRIARAQVHLARILARLGDIDSVPPLLASVDDFLSKEQNEALAPHARYVRALLELSAGRRSPAEELLSELAALDRPEPETEWLPSAARARAAALHIADDPATARIALDTEAAKLDSLLGPSHPETRAAREASARIVQRP